MSEDQFIAAWRSNSGARVSFIAEATRELSKTGSLEGHSDVLQCLSRYLSQDEVLVLFQLFQESKRPESEWRDEFLALFPTVNQSDIPKPIVDEEAAERAATEAREKQDFGQVQPGSPDVLF